MNLCERLQVFSSTVYPAVVFQGLARTAAPLLILSPGDQLRVFYCIGALVCGVRQMSLLYICLFNTRNAKKVFDLAT